MHGIGAYNAIHVPILEVDPIGFNVSKHISQWKIPFLHPLP